MTKKTENKIKTVTLVKSTKKGDVEINVLESQVDELLKDKRFSEKKGNSSYKKEESKPEKKED